MEIRSTVRTAATALVLFGSPLMADVNRPGSPIDLPLAAPLASSARGILTGRLTGKQLRTWERIRSIVFATYSLGRPLYPTLEGLWLQAATSGHRIYVELVDRRIPGCAAVAGFCKIERVDPKGLGHTIIIRLDLNWIDRAHVGNEARRPDGFIPFRGLRNEQRYAEVLGHELAHAVQFVRDAEYRRIYEDLDRSAREYLLRGTMRGEAGPREERAVLRTLLESPAAAAEVKIWRELTADRPGLGVRSQKDVLSVRIGRRK